MRGAPDDSNVLSRESLYRLDDLSELAVRLGSPIVFQRSGTVRLQDVFDTGLQKVTGHSLDAGVTRYLSNDRSISEGVSLCIDCPMLALRSGKINYTTPNFPDTLRGMSWGFSAVLNQGLIEARVLRYTGTRVHTYKVQYDMSNRDLSVWDGDDGWAVVSDNIYLMPAGRQFATFKVVFNASSKGYIRLWVNNHEYDLTDYAAEEGGSGIVPQTVHSLYTENPGIVDNWYYLDNIVLTDNEVPR